MKDLKLPVIKGYVSPPAKILSMDEYLKFVQFNFDQTLDKKAYWKRKKVIAVNVPFRIKKIKKAANGRSS